jgi:hypothetical protein
VRSHVSSLVAWCRLWAATFCEVAPTLAVVALLVLASGAALALYIELR